MKTFRIYETKPATYTWVYEVQAETEEQAIQMVEDGYAEAYDMSADVDTWANSDYESEEIEEQN